MRVVKFVLLGVVSVFIFFGVLVLSGYAGMFIALFVFQFQGVVGAMLWFAIGAVVGLGLAILAFRWFWSLVKKGVFGDF